MFYAKRGQGGMEWLMTYGWAILVVIISIAALAYFDVFRVPKLVPDECILPAGLACTGSSISASNGVSLVITNSLQQRLYDFNVSVPNCGTTIAGASGDDLEVSETETFNITCTETLFDGNLFESDVDLVYATGQNPLTRLTHTLSGKVAGPVTE